MKNLILIQAALILLLADCSQKNNLSDAYGNFETKEIMVSAEASGKILQFDAEEGQIINAGDTIGYIDSIPIYLQKQQLKAAIEAIKSKKINISAQADVFQEQKKSLMVEKNRIERLFADGAATQQQMDQVTGQLNTVESQIKATETQYISIDSETNSIIKQIDQVNEQIRKCYIINPLYGTMLEKYAETYEIAMTGKVLYKIANLNTMDLRAYVSGEQLPYITLGQKVTVLIDKDEKNNQEMEGIIAWISDKSEFTPKIIQTKEERVNLVYAIKVEVKNDGRIKIGMPGEIRF
jgi:HlyD family secretion protein